MIKFLDLLNGSSNLLMYFLGFLFIVTALLMILAESAVHSILCLMFLFLYLTELTILLKIEFLALIFLIIYVGAVCVLMLFHIKLIKTFVHRFDQTYSQEYFLKFILVSFFLPLVQILTLMTSDLKKLSETSNHFLIQYSTLINSSDAFNYTKWVDLYETFKNMQILASFYIIFILFI